MIEKEKKLNQAIIKRLQDVAMNINMENPVFPIEEIQILQEIQLILTNDCFTEKDIFVQTIHRLIKPLDINDDEAFDKLVKEIASCEFSDKVWMHLVNNNVSNLSIISQKRRI